MTEAAAPRTVRPARPHGPTAREAALHADLVKRLTDPVWEP